MPALSRHRSLFAALGLALLLGGCAYAPGLYMARGTPMPEAAAEEPPPPPNALIPITPQLIREQQAAAPARSADALQVLLQPPQPYTVGPSDVLGIVVWGHPDINLPASGGTVGEAAAGYLVGPQGDIQFPFLGSVPVAGLNEAQVRERLATGLARFIKDPQLTVRIAAYRSARVYLDGEVRNPGLQAVNDVPMTLPEALARAGGFTPNANRSAIAITRQGRTYAVDLPRLTAEGVNPSQLLLAAGDMVRVFSREDAKVFVMGEVLRPSATPMRFDGRLNLNEALGESGGLNPGSANASQIYVLRSRSGQDAQIFHLNASTPVAYALAEGFQLQPRDVVFVDPAPLVRWNRVISLLLPSAQAVNVTRDATGN